MTVKELLSACEMRIEYVDVDVLGSDTVYYGLTESQVRSEFCTCSVVCFDYDNKTHTLGMRIEG